MYTKDAIVRYFAVTASESRLLKTIGENFVGWVHFPDHRVLRTTTKKRMFRNIKAKDGKEETVQSYLGLISHGNSWKLRQKILRKGNLLN